MCTNIWSWYGKVLKNLTATAILCFILLQSSSMEMDPEAALELKKRSSLLREHGIGKSLI